jgi:predicted dehydrogenase
LAGTGHWARTNHAPALASERAVEFAAVWGRNGDQVSELACEFAIDGYTDFIAFLEGVDAVAFALPPDIQVRLAIRAANAGKHLLLEKPIATSVTDARALVECVDGTGVSSVVFFTERFSATTREWLAVVGQASWKGAWARWLASSFVPGNPYALSAWRREKGALWDVGPHIVALLIAALGPIVDVHACAGEGDLVYLVLHHAEGPTSTAALTLGAPPGANSFELSLWGELGISTLPVGGFDPKLAFRTAARELVANASLGEPSHECDVRFGASIVTTLANAERQIAKYRE